MSTLSVVHSTPDYPVPATPPVSGSLLPPADQSIPDLISQHGAALLRFALKLTLGDRERAQDIYQETLIRAWKHPELCQENVFASRRWLFTVARRVSIDQLRAAAIRPAVVSDEQWLTEVCDPEDQIGRLLLAKEVRAAIKTLSPAHREVLREVYFEDCTVAQAAGRLGIPVGTAKSRIYYALRALKDALAARGMDRSLAESA
ncbi:MAG TPA: sigma-70 family RNA polymerase sigma factor [Streptosporangiaceae bacterium]|jgi:RNA polymerase sigma-70 factor (ECF subfamily)|nr:sigma-70 family RNA polymerase sigma factor [Streptosporangiaceae bacterium]